MLSKTTTASQIICLLAFLANAVSNVHAKAGQVVTVGNSGVSAQMTFLVDDSHVMFMDKVENNPLKVNGHSAWVSRFNTKTGAVNAYDVRTNTFCAGGAMGGDGRVYVMGGNSAVGTNQADQGQGNKAPYYDTFGGFALNIYDPATDTWEQHKKGMQRNRWYASAESLSDGSIIIVGGQSAGGFVSTNAVNEPTYEFIPSRGSPITMPILQRTVPLNLFPLTFLMSTGELFVLSNRQAVLWNLDSRSETRLPNIPDVPRPYPASAGAAMLPMRADRNYQQRLLFCGGLSLGTAANWGDLNGPKVQTTNKAASTSCQSILPLEDKTWNAMDPLPEGRSMGMFIHLPDGTLFFGGGVTKGTAGYMANSASPGKPVGQSLGDAPSYTPLILDPTQPSGSQWRAYGHLPHERMYHSSATLLADGSILIAGSNPRDDVSSAHWPTSYFVDIWYPPFYDQTRPSNSQLPSTFAHGGANFTIDLGTAAVNEAYVRLIRTGFSTHGINWGQRSLQMGGSLSADRTKLTVQGLTSNKNVLTPGPALAFLVIDGIPSVGKFVQIGDKTIGSGKLKSSLSVDKDALSSSPNASALLEAAEDQAISDAIAALPADSQGEGSLLELQKHLRRSRRMSHAVQ